ncbi:MAG TPA: hypothetical protein VKB09_14080 [Thermomicrobiales bacterium]|nr:hypothetical protein [Thermomicrobiales bacterium]
MKTPVLLVGRVAAAIALLVAWTIGGRSAEADASIPNVQVTDAADLAHVEPSVAVNPANPKNLLAATQLLPEPGPGPTTLGAYASFDGGRIWQDVGPLPLPTGTNTGDDVTVAFDADGHGFICAMVTSEEGGQMSRDDRNVAIWRTDDGGRTFAAPVLAVSHQFVDHPWLAVDPVSGALYLAWVADEHASEGFTRSTDGGATFDPPRNVATPPGSVSGAIVAVANGAVAIAYETGINGRDPFAGEEDEETDAANAPAAQQHAGEVDAQIEVLGSTDGGTTFGDPAAVAQVVSEPALPGDVHLPFGESLAIEPDGAVDLAYVATDPDTGQFHVLLAHAAGAGQPFDPPVTVDTAWSGEPPAFFQPHVVVDESGAIAVTAFALADDRVDLVLWQTASPAVPFGPATRVTSESFDPAHGMPGTKHGAWWIGDYQGLATGGGVLHALWNDTRTGNLQLFAAAIPIPTNAS